jgi:hypothetical protein
MTVQMVKAAIAKTAMTPTTIPAMAPGETPAPEESESVEGADAETLVLLADAEAPLVLLPEEPTAVAVVEDMVAGELVLVAPVASTIRVEKILGLAWKFVRCENNRPIMVTYQSPRKYRHLKHQVLGVRRSLL